MSISIVHQTPRNPHAAAENRREFETHGTICLNLLGSAGSGKTSLLEAIVPRLKAELRVGVVAGDLATAADSTRLEALNIPCVHVLTDGRCHLSAAQLQHALHEMPLAELDLVIVENVGDLLCQAAEDLGEHLRATVLSVSAGHRMATKYAPAYRDSRLIIVTKCALLPHVEFEMQPTLEFLSRISPGAEIICTDTHARNGIGRLTGWLLGYVRVQQTPRTHDRAPAVGLAAATL